MSSTDETRRIVAEIYDAGGRGDRDGMFRLVNDDIVVSPPPYFPWGGPHTSARAWREDAMPMLGAVHERASLKYELIVDGERCVADISIGLKDSDAVMRYLEVWRVRDGKAVQMDVYCFDPRPMEEQIARLGLG